jgi:uncharacterized membrane protein YkvA (DUF1232 family)
VPIARKSALMAAFAFIVSPFDLPAWVPVVGEADLLVLTLLATGLFVDTAPAEIVEEHRHAIALHQSIFDRDVEQGRRVAVMLKRRLRRESPAAGELQGVPVEHLASYDHSQTGVAS